MLKIVDRLNDLLHCRFFCPVCGRKIRRFLPLPDFYRNNALKHGYRHFGKGETIALDTYACPACGASDRERLYADWIVRQVDAGNFHKGARLLHFAPEAALSKRLHEMKFFDYQTADFKSKNVDYQIDVMNLPIKNNVYDYFICSHVLEHVESDEQAIRELYRITKTGGCGILMTPIIMGLKATVEDKSIASEAERWKLYGQNDHVRLYAHDDYVSKIRRVGFCVNELGIAYFGADTFRLLGLKKTSILYIVKKT